MDRGLVRMSPYFDETAADFTLSFDPEACRGSYSIRILNE